MVAPLQSVRACVHVLRGYAFPAIQSWVVLAFCCEMWRESIACSRSEHTGNNAATDRLRVDSGAMVNAVATGDVRKYSRLQQSEQYKDYRAYGMFVDACGLLSHRESDYRRCRFRQ
eukprot:6185249-Pleurochrysis_carterae.AAC.3